MGRFYGTGIMPDKDGIGKTCPTYGSVPIYDSVGHTKRTTCPNLG